MAKHDEHPLAERNPEDLSPDQWRVLTSYRLRKLEDRVDGLFKAMWTIAGGIIVGVVVFLMTSGRHAAAAALRVLGLA